MLGLLNPESNVTIDPCAVLHTNDIAVFAHGDELHIKRVAASVGDTFAVRDNSLLVNNLPIINSQGLELKLSEPQVSIWTDYSNINKNSVPLGAFLMLGNIQNCRDSRTYGFVFSPAVLGKVINIA
jgi:signal peptidase I